MEIWVVRTIDVDMLGGTTLNTYLHGDKCKAWACALEHCGMYLSEFTETSLLSLIKVRKCESRLMTEHGYTHPSEITLTCSDENVDGYEYVEISVDDNVSWFRCEILKQNLDGKDD